MCFTFPAHNFPIYPSQIGKLCLLFDILCRCWRLWGSWDKNFKNNSFKTFLLFRNPPPPPVPQPSTSEREPLLPPARRGIVPRWPSKWFLWHMKNWTSWFLIHSPISQSVVAHISTCKQNHFLHWPFYLFTGLHPLSRLTKYSWFLLFGPKKT